MQVGRSGQAGRQVGASLAFGVRFRMSDSWDSVDPGARSQVRKCSGSFVTAVWGSRESKGVDRRWCGGDVRNGSLRGGEEYA